MHPAIREATTEGCLGTMRIDTAGNVLFKEKIVCEREVLLNCSTTPLSFYFVLYRGIQSNNLSLVSFAHRFYQDLVLKYCKWENMIKNLLSGWFKLFVHRVFLRRKSLFLKKGGKNPPGLLKCLSFHLESSMVDIQLLSPNSNIHLL